MTTGIYSIFDVKSAKYGPLISFENDLMAIRSFTEMLISGDKNSMLSLYPQDYLLHCLGHYDRDTGKLIPDPAPQMIISGTEAIIKAIDEVNRRKRMREALEKGELKGDNQLDSVLPCEPIGSVDS